MRDVNKFWVNASKEDPVPLTDFTPEDTLIALMISVSASDETIRTSELISIERMVNHLPVFSGYDMDRIREVSNRLFSILADEDGLDVLWATVRRTLPERLYDTAYAMACDVAAADGAAREGELRFLEEMRYELNLDRLLASAIEAGARARHRKL
jgi:tellurite resistance protein